MIRYSIISLTAIVAFVTGCESMGVNPEAAIGPPGREARGGGIFTGEDGGITGEFENNSERRAREAGTGADDDEYQTWKLEQERAEYEAWKAEQSAE